MFDPIPAHEFCKYFVCKVASPVTDDSLGCSESAQNVLLQETHNCVSVIPWKSYCFHLFVNIIHCYQYVQVSK